MQTHNATLHVSISLFQDETHFVIFPAFHSNIPVDLLQRLLNSMGILDKYLGSFVGSFFHRFLQLHSLIHRSGHSLMGGLLLD